MAESFNFNNNDDLESGPEVDHRLRFFPLDELELIRNAQNQGVEFQDYRPHPEFSYLKEGSLNLGEMGLTDRQLMAVALVFYGGLKKKLAAQIMKISSQALTDHINAGLKKMSSAF